MKTLFIKYYISYRIQRSIVADITRVFYCFDVSVIHSIGSLVVINIYSIYRRLSYHTMGGYIYIEREDSIRSCI